jgi:hypothetical protein
VDEDARVVVVVVGVPADVRTPVDDQHAVAVRPEPLGEDAAGEAGSDDEIVKHGPCSRRQLPRRPFDSDCALSRHEARRFGFTTMKASYSAKTRAPLSEAQCSEASKTRPGSLKRPSYCARVSSNVTRQSSRPHSQRKLTFESDPKSLLTSLIRSFTAR